MNLSPGTGEYSISSDRLNIMLNSDSVTLNQIPSDSFLSAYRFTNQIEENMKFIQNTVNRFNQ
jgi:hypothetical protein